MSGQNTSSAVMQQRREPSDSFDYFPTPPWATRALLEKLGGYIDPSDLVREPACGEGHMARPLMEYFSKVEASDIQDLGFGEHGDYLFPGADVTCDWTFTNPPFKIADQFIQTALQNSRKGVAMFVRSAFKEGVKRHQNLWSVTPYSYEYQFAERVILHKGRVLDPAVKYFCEHSQKWKKPSTATSYSWLVWIKGCNHEPYGRWIEPCRRRLERPGDYA